MEGYALKNDSLQVVTENKCPYCGGVQLVNRGIGYAIGDMLVKWKYQCANNNCKQQFYIREDLSQY
ncbi:MAG: hypothetical protein ACM3O9_06240 [Methylocystaceae bacterium]